MNILVLSTIELFGFQLMTCLGEAGHRVHLCNDAHWSLPDRLSRHCDKHIYQPKPLLAEGSSDLVDFINSYCRSNHIDIVMAADMRCTKSIAKVCDQITEARVGAMPGMDSIDLLHDKWLFSKFLKRHNLPTPQTVRLNKVADAQALAIPYPVIVKPPAGENGEGIRRIDAHEQLMAYLNEPGQYSTCPLLVQRYIKGRDIDISLLADHGKIVAWTIQQRDAQDPGTIHFLDNPEILRITRKIVHESNYHGVAHIDMRIEDDTDQVYVIELNPRFWGSLIWSFWAGVNFPDLLAHLTLGLEPPGAVTAEPGPCTHCGLACGRLADSLLHGRTMPTGLSTASANAWRTNHTDPLPQVFFKLSGYLRRLTG